jgi:hypothetical protein
MRKLALFAAAAWLLLAAILISPQSAEAKNKIWTGRVVHVSTTNIKVYNPTGHQTLSFLLLPKFKNVFSSDGKTTYQMAKIRNGMYVKVWYDQGLLGARHADKIYVSSNGAVIKS